MTKMFKTLLEQKPIGTFYYRRYEGVSKITSEKNTVGIIYPTLDPGFIPEQSIYFFHGGDSNDQLFVQFLDLLSEKNKELLLEKKIQLVLPFIGLTYLKPPHDQQFLEEVMPWAEKKMNLAGVKNFNRMLHGVSMGGTGALNIFLKNIDLFSGIALHFAGLIGFNPFNEDESKAYQERTKITDEKLGILIYCYQTPFSDYADFQANDPLKLISHCDLQKLKQKKIYFDCGSKDDFGLHLGAQQFDQLLSDSAIPHEMQIREGEHNLKFIQNHLNQSFQFLLQ